MIDDVLPRLMAEADLRAGSVEALNRAHARPALFLDCDGVLNYERGDPGVVSPDEVKLIPGAGGALKRARAAGLLTVAITNRPQVATSPSIRSPGSGSRSMRRAISTPRKQPSGA